MTNKNVPSRRLTFMDAVNIWIEWLVNHTFQNRIAAKYDVNPGRVNEVLKEKRHIGAKLVALQKLGLV